MSRYRKYYYNDEPEGAVGVLILLAIGFVYNFYKKHTVLFFIILGLIVVVIGFIIYKKIMKKQIITTIEEPFEIKDKDNLYKGQLNEYEIYEKLYELNFDKKLLKNVYIPIEKNKTTEIDIIMITNRGIFVIESKNYNGWIFGSSNSKYWTLTKNKHFKRKFYNPVWQNKIHVNSLSNMLGIELNNFESIICFGPNSVLKTIEKFESDIKVININSICEVINNLYNVKSDVFSNEEVDDIYNKLRSYKYVDESIKEKHINNVNDIKKDNFY